MNSLAVIVHDNIHQHEIHVGVQNGCHLGWGGGGRGGWSLRYSMKAGGGEGGDAQTGNREIGDGTERRHGLSFREHSAAVHLLPASYSSKTPFQQFSCGRLLEYWSEEQQRIRLPLRARLPHPDAE